MIKVKVLVLPDILVDVLGFVEKEIELPEGKHTFKDIIEHLKKVIPKLLEVLNTKELNKEIFIAINGQVFYDLDHEIHLDDGSRISIFTVGAGG